MKIILTTLCLLVASTTASHAVLRDLRILKNGEVIAFHSPKKNYYFYTVKYDNKLFWCSFNLNSRDEVKCREMKK